MTTLSNNWRPVDIVWTPNSIADDLLRPPPPPSLCVMLPVWGGVSEL